MKGVRKTSARAERGRSRGSALAKVRRLPALERSVTIAGVVLGAPEIAGLTSALLLVVLAALSYFYLLAPARARLEKAQGQIADERRRLEAGGDGLRQGNAQQATVEEVIASLRDFEARNLPAAAEGQQAAIEFLYAAIRRHNLRNKGQSFAVVDPARDQASARASSGGRQPTIFPALNITVGVEGAYPEVRRFINDIETSAQFIVVNGVELEGVRDEGGGANTSVNLNLSLTAYFRPPAAAQGDDSARDSSADRGASIASRRQAQ